MAREALTTRPLFDQLGVTEAEERLVRMDPGYDTASTASRVDAFLLPDGVHFAEYNAESPAGPGYTQRLAELFDALPTMARFRELAPRSTDPTIEPLLGALLDSYREWGGRAQPPTIAIVDWREVPTWTEFEILRDAFIAGGVPTLVCDPRDLEFDGAGTVGAGPADRSRLPARAASTTSSRSPTNAPRWSRPTRPGRSASPTRSAASCRTRRRSSRC